MTSKSVEWIALDWGTSNLRGWAMQGGTSIAQATSDAGMGGLSGDGFADALRALVADWTLAPNTPVIACGMVGSRQGWVEAPYTAVPTAPLQGNFARTNSDIGPVYVIPGLRQDTPADVMRGEETQIAGFLALNPGWDGVICLPGTHTKWAHVSAGEVVSFQTFMSGEIFALLGEASVLKHSVGGEAVDDAAFASAVEAAISRPERLAATLFSVRAQDLLHGASAAVGRGTLSGTLIGSELAAARPYWLGQNIALIGDDKVAALYARALQAQGVQATATDAPRMTLAGLTAAYRLLKGAPA